MRTRAPLPIAPVDSPTRQVGEAGASCIEGAENIAGMTAGHGAIAGKSMTNAAERDLRIELLRGCRSPAAISKEITGQGGSGFEALDSARGPIARLYACAARKGADSQWV